jgi:serine/threonine-protein kinase
MPYAYPRLSPDESQIAIDVNTPDRDILMWNLQGRSTLRRFSLDDSANPLLAWTRDGRRIVYGSFRSGVPNLYIQDVRSGAVHRLTDSPRLQMPLSFAPRGQLLFSEEVPGHQRDIRALSLDDPRLVTTVVGTSATEGWAEVSPDGRWLAYDSDESGDFEVYVMRYGATGPTERRRVSSGGGKQPLWSRSGHELYYRDFRGALLVVKNSGGSPFTPSEPIEVLEGGRYFAAGRGLSGRTYDVDRDGRFLMVKNNVDGEATVLVQVRNWFKQGKRQNRRGATR